ncbi:hypothetical protein L6258_00650 [Candidatus Parcubacteria bacterium]|nr:hypothetical protein [Candidatus Parcubacteria bacterium]
MLRGLSKRLRREVGVPLVTAPVAEPETIVSAPPEKKKRRRFGGTELFLVVVILVVGVILAESNGIVDFGVTRRIANVVNQLLGGESTAFGGGISVAAREEYSHSGPVNESISASQSIPVGNIGEIVSVPGFEYDTDAMLRYYQELLAFVGATETPAFRVTVYHTVVTQEMVNTDPRVGSLRTHELRTDVPIHIKINAWAALGHQSGDLLVMSDRIALELLMAVRDYFGVPSREGHTFAWYSWIVQNPLVTAYRP